MQNTKRIESLDVFRGLCIAGMILVDHPGSWEHTYPAFTHSYWNGCSFADYIFPFFLFIMGVSLTLSVSSNIKKGFSKEVIRFKIIKRSFLLIALGIFLNGFPFFNWNGSFTLIDFSNYRIMGVLQRIGIVYLICSFLYLRYDIKKLIAISVSILIGYWILLSYVPVPGFGLPDLINHPDGKITNLPVWLDNLILGNHTPTWSPLFDPEGILSTIPSIVTGLLGVITGVWIKKGEDIKTSLIWMAVWGGILIITAFMWETVFPINKQLWTSSYVLLTGGWALLTFVSFYWIIDFSGRSKYFNQLKILGMNAIFIFSISIAKIFFLYAVQINWNGKEVSLKDQLAEILFFNWLPDLPASFGYAVFSLIIFQLIAVWMYKKKKFVKI